MDYNMQYAILKGNNKRGKLQKLYSNGLDIERFKAAQREELIVPGQNIAFSSKGRLILMSATNKWPNEAYISGLGVPEAFCSLLFWIKQESKLHVQL